MFKKKKLLIIVGVILVLGAIGSLFDSEDSAQNGDATPRTDVAMDVSKLDTENIKSIVADVTDAQEIQVNIDGKDVEIKIYREVILDASSLIKKSARDTVDIFRELYQNPELNEVWIYEEALVQDEKGKESKDTVITINTNRETIEGVDWDNIRTRVVNDSDELANISVGYTLSPVLAN